ncbi:hypothetical protein MK131_02540 [Candidatus Poribacteria bacterium]|nr:hypothetical protein [Candidatus Poribacteria bacterium]
MYQIVIYDSNVHLGFRWSCQLLIRYIKPEESLRRRPELDNQFWRSQPDQCPCAGPSCSRKTLLALKIILIRPYVVEGD